MKRPEYVAAAVKACRNSVDGIRDSELRDDLRLVFSRSGFTDGYYSGKLGVDMFGIRRKDDVTAASGVLKKLQKQKQLKQKQLQKKQQQKLKHN